MARFTYMKTLMALSLVQTVLIIFLLVKIAASDGDVSLSAHEQQILPVSDETSLLSTSLQSNANYSNTGEERLRQIIREELSYYLETSSGSVNQERANTASIPRDKAKDDYQQELVDQKIEYYKSVGTISDNEMQELQMEIAKLNGTDQKQMLSKLVKALNSGEIGGSML